MADKHTLFSPIVRELPAYTPTTANNNAEIIQSSPLDRYSSNLIGLATINPQVMLLECANVVVRSDYKTCREVRVVSGGPAGWEPAFSHFVGPGFLTATVQGELNVAPTTKHILKAIRELSVNHVGGTLIIVRGDIPTTISFGLAIERARNEGIYTKLLTVNDDALNIILTKNKKLNRGLAGIILIEKIAGAMAQSGKSLLEMYEFCLTATEFLLSSLVALIEPTSGSTYPISGTPRKCSISGTKNNEKKPNCFCNEYKPDVEGVQDVKIEIKDISQSKPSKSLGSQADWESQDETNELPAVDTPEDIKPKVSKSESFSLARVAKELVEQLNQAGFDLVSLPLVVLFNTTKHLSKLDEMELCREIMKIFLDLQVNVIRFYTGAFMTLPGISLSVLRVFSLDVLPYLDQPAKVMGWNGLTYDTNYYLTFDSIIANGRLVRKELLTPQIRGPALTSFQTAILELVTQFACDALISCERQINIIDKDHDLGSRLKMACNLIIDRLKSKRLITNYPFTFFISLSRLLESRLGGLSGSIYGIMCEKVGKYFAIIDVSEEIGIDTWLAALEQAVKAVKKYGNVDFGDMTMYDPLYGCYEVFRRDYNSGAHYLDAFCAGLQAAERIVDNTKDANGKYPDVGCHVVGIWLRAVFEAVKLRCS